MGTLWPLVSMYVQGYVNTTGLSFRTFEDAAYSTIWLAFFMVSGTELILGLFSLMAPLDMMNTYLTWVDFAGTLGSLMFYALPIVFFILATSQDSPALVLQGKSLAYFIVSIVMWVFIPTVHFATARGLNAYGKQQLEEHRARFIQAYKDNLLGEHTTTIKKAALP